MVNFGKTTRAQWSGERTCVPYAGVFRKGMRPRDATSASSDGSWLRASVAEGSWHSGHSQWGEYSWVDPRGTRWVSDGCPVKCPNSKCAEWAGTPGDKRSGTCILKWGHAGKHRCASPCRWPADAKCYGCKGWFTDEESEAAARLSAEKESFWHDR